MTWKPPGSRELAGGVLWNGLGQGLPLIAALVLVPRLVHGLGVDRFGVLSLAWMLIGYFTLFDLGISGALTRLVSERLGRARHDDVPPLVGTGLALTTVLGVAGGVLIAALAPWLVERVLRIPEALAPEARRLIVILGATLPVVTATAALTGLLAAERRFGALNAVRVPLGVLTYAAPVLVLPFSSSLVAMGLALAAVRVLAAAAYLFLCFAAAPGLRERVAVRRELVRPILDFGSWMTVTAVVGPVMVYFDRFLIGALLSMAMVAYYTAPYDMVSRLTLLSIPVVSVLFPAVAARFDTDRARTGRLYDGALRAVGVLLFPFALALGVFAPEVLRAWLGAEFAAQGAGVLRWLAIGVFVNGVAQLALAMVQGSGRPDLAAKLHAAELPLYLALLVWLVRTRGIEGAAIAWMVRVLVDAAVLFAMARARLGAGVPWGRGAVVASGAAAAAIAGGALLPGWPVRVAFASAALAVWALVAWRFVARPGARAVLANAGAEPAA